MPSYFHQRSQLKHTMIACILFFSEEASLAFPNFWNQVSKLKVPSELAPYASDIVLFDQYGQPQNCRSTTKAVF